MSGQSFRAGVVIVVRRPDDHGQVLAFERRDAPGSWQLPQGGLDEGETPIEGAWRELFEETGLGEDHVVAVAEYPDWIVYEWPDELKRHGELGVKRLGQVQRWFLFDARSADIQPTPDGTEFVAWRWVRADWLIDHVIEWRRPAYQKVLSTL